MKDKLAKFDDEITLAKAELQKTFDLKDSTREDLPLIVKNVQLRTNFLSTNSNLYRFF